MRVMYNLLEFGVDGILTGFKHCSGHLSHSGGFDLVLRWTNHSSFNLFWLARVTFGLSSNTRSPTVLIVPSYDHQPMRVRQPRFVLTFDMLVWAYHIGGYRRTCQPINSITSVRLCPVR
ncbi:hypothetical protein AMTRI_Chr08g201770 [Amborella trichopoda]